MESEINRTLVQHIFKSNNLASDKQLAYRVEYSTELLLIHLTESWGRAVDSGMAVATAFIEFKKSVWPNMQLPQWKTTIYCAKWCKVIDHWPLNNVSVFLWLKKYNYNSIITYLGLPSSSKYYIYTYPWNRVIAEPFVAPSVRFCYNCLNNHSRPVLS